MPNARDVPRDALARLGESPPPSLPPGVAMPATGIACDSPDDSTTRYVLATRPGFEDLRHAAGQIAALLILQATGARSAVPDHPMLAQARQSCDAARDAIAAIRPPAAAAHHHEHLRRALALITRACKQAAERLDKRGADDVEAILGPLREGWREMHAAAGALPGFETVNFGAACCAMHGRVSPARPPAR